MLSLIKFFEGWGASCPSVLPVISLIGGGGKTTLLYVLAHELRSTGQRVITTTTTHIFPPTVAQSPACLLNPTPDEIQAGLAAHGHITVAREHMPNGKLAGLPFEAVEALRGHKAVLLIEADGAARHPLKAPANHEPAVPPCTDICLALCGLGGIGKPVGETVHRPELACALCGCAPTDLVQPEHLAHLTLHADGLFRACPPAAQQAVLCVVPEGMDKEHGLALAHKATLAARALYPQSTAPWWAGSPLDGWIQDTLL